MQPDWCRPSDSSSSTAETGRGLFECGTSLIFANDMVLDNPDVAERLKTLDNYLDDSDLIRRIRNLDVLMAAQFFYVRHRIVANPELPAGTRLMALDQLESAITNLPDFVLHPKEKGD